MKYVLHKTAGTGTITDVHTLFREVDASKITDDFKEIGPYYDQT